MKINRRCILALAGFAAALLNMPAAIAAETPVRGGTIVASMDLQPKSLDPIMGDAPNSDRYVLLQIFESLLRFDERGNLQPALAESWSYSDDKKSILFKLRRGVTFHDGTPFDAEAAAFNLRRAISPEVNAPRRGDLADIESVDVVDAYTLRVNLKDTSGAALASLAVEAGMMSSPTAIKKYGQDYGRYPVGTGPFKFVEWVAGSHVDLERNENYWRIGEDGKPLPYVDKVRLRFIPNTAVKLVEVRSGNVHIVDGVTPKDFEAVEKDSNLRLVKVPPGIAQWVALNTTLPPFNDPKLRRALSVSINRDQIMKMVTRGYGMVIPTVVAATDWSYDENVKPHPYDPAEAKKLLAEAGKPDGFKATLSVIQRDPDTQIAQIMQQQLKQVGIDLEIEILERQAWVSKVLNGKTHQAALGRVNVPRADPDHVFGLFFGRDAAQNWSVITDEALFRVVDEARRSIDPAERKKYYTEAQQILLDNTYYAFLFFREARHVARKEVKSLTIDAGGAWLLGYAWLEK